MHAVAVADPSTTILGIRTSLPVFVSPAAMAGLGHSGGECNITRGAGAMGIVQGVRLFPTLRSWG
jgi:L-lactate dehydrogenase (cytochrome)